MNQDKKGPIPVRPILERPNTRKAHTRKAQNYIVIHVYSEETSIEIMMFLCYYFSMSVDLYSFLQTY